MCKLYIVCICMVITCILYYFCPGPRNSSKGSVAGRLHAGLEGCIPLALYGYSNAGTQKFPSVERPATEPAGPCTATGAPVLKSARR